jgi:hypothetical protein
MKNSATRAAELSARMNVTVLLGPQRHAEGVYRAVLVAPDRVSMEVLRSDGYSRWHSASVTALENETCWTLWVTRDITRKDLAKASAERGIPAPVAWREMQS